MGLRFRKSITLCKGIKLNLGKTGASVTLEPKGFHKTIHTSGKVTTSVGLPGTGIYWTDTKNLNGSSGKNRNGVNFARRNNIEEGLEEFDINSITEDYLIKPIVDEINEDVSEPIYEEESSMYNEHSQNKEEIINDDINVQTRYLTKVDIKNIYNRCDDIVEWTEIISGATADDLLMDYDKWKFCQSVAGKILSGNIDTYLLVIETLKPVDDLLLYGGEFEFGTDKPTYMEVEFRVEPTKLLEKGKHDDLLEELVSGTAIRVSRDLMALLPISKTIIHVTIDDKTILSVLFEKNKMVGLDYKTMSAMEIISKNFIKAGKSIDRVSL